jgi:hypothetical protein
MGGGGPAHLGGEPIGDPDFRAERAEKLLHNLLAAARADDKIGRVSTVENPDPPGLIGDPGAGLVGLEERATEQALAQRFGLTREGRGAAGQNVGQPALAEDEAEKIGQQPRQPGKRDALRKAQIQNQSPQVRPKRRARL